MSDTVQVQATEYKLIPVWLSELGKVVSMDFRDDRREGDVVGAVAIYRGRVFQLAVDTKIGEAWGVECGIRAQVAQCYEGTRTMVELAAKFFAYVVADDAWQEQCRRPVARHGGDEY